MPPPKDDPKAAQPSTTADPDSPLLEAVIADVRNTTQGWAQSRSMSEGEVEDAFEADRDLQDLICTHCRGDKDKIAAFQDEFLNLIIARRTNRLDQFIDQLERSAQLTGQRLLDAVNGGLTDEAVDILVNYRMLPMAVRDEKGRGALELAVRRNNPRLVEIMMKHEKSSDVRADPGVLSPGGEDVTDMAEKARPGVFTRALASMGLGSAIAKVNRHSEVVDAINRDGKPFDAGSLITSRREAQVPAMISDVQTRLVVKVRSQDALTKNDTEALIREDNQLQDLVDRRFGKGKGGAGENFTDKLAKAVLDEQEGVVLQLMSELSKEPAPAPTAKEKQGEKARGRDDDDRENRPENRHSGHRDRAAGPGYGPGPGYGGPPMGPGPGYGPGHPPPYGQPGVYGAPRPAGPPGGPPFYGPPPPGRY